MPNPNGNPNYNLPGRPKGRKNEFTELKDKFLKAFAHTGDADGMIEWIMKSDKNRSLFYTLIAKMLPSNVKVDDEGRVSVVEALAKFAEVHARAIEGLKRGNK